MEHPEELQRIVRAGPFNDLFLALQARHLFQVIGEHADRINRSSFAPVFATYQLYALDEFVLATTRLLERESGRYELQSVHGALRFLAGNAAAIPLKQPAILQQSMERLGAWADRIGPLTGERQAVAVAELLIERLPHHSENKALDALKSLRDKRIAHPERVDADSLPATTWPDADALLRIPTEALAVLGAYVSDGHVDVAGRLLMESDAGRAAFATLRSLRQLGIVEPLKR
jgi:hypothetical protein